MAVSVDKERAIHKAAIQVISEYGFHKAKMAKIAEMAGVSAEVSIPITATRTIF